MKGISKIAAPALSLIVKQSETGLRRLRSASAHMSVAALNASR